MRIGIVGGGIAGLTAAWLLDPEHEVTVLEARESVGGHADSAEVALPGGGTMHADLGAQYISPVGFPAHGKLLAALGLAGDRLAPAPVTLAVTNAASGTAPLLVSPHAPDPGRRPVLGSAWRALNDLLVAAAEFKAAGGAWDVPLADLIEPLQVPRVLKDRLLYPLVAYITCCANEEAPEVSARAATDFYLAVAPEAEDHAPVWANPSGGMQELARKLSAGLRGTVRTGAPAATLRKQGEHLHIGDGRGGETIVDRVVLATQAPAAVSLLSHLAGTAPLRLLLARFAYTQAVVALHRDPAYMPAVRRHWSVVNLEVHDGWAEASNWYGPVHGAQVFKSWITYRDAPPADLIASRSFDHLVVTPAAVRARARLSERQGQGGIYHAGSHLTGIDSQESAVGSAIDVARRIDPAGRRLKEVS
ncbi:FAD-dependent oxidoreductase [Actinomadura rubrisoli]|uniref:FAD-dependent oxidoreductase n=1 Tax=Actinomadura rubrisoli TaxID=2530368 RepID=UPI0014052AC5|nr:FAD-dependent oxidoreductase [Actinomadura rubrisoli]